MNRTIRIFATSDLITDQRVHRTASSLTKAGYRVILTGRKPSGIKSKVSFPYKVKYIGCLFSKGPLFYLMFNFRIFFTLIFSRFSAVYANDLDTLPGCWFASIFRFKPLIYDSHELFPDIPELIGRPIKKAIWKMSERLFIRRAKYVFTVSESVAKELKRRYNVNPIVVRNTSIKREIEAFKDKRPTLLYQGSLNKGRGIEVAIDMMNFLTCYRLVIVGKGDVEIELRQRMLDQKLFDRVEFAGRLEPDDLYRLTCTAWIGLSLEEDLGLNYRYALPNKVFDYIAAQVPVFVSDLPEMRKLVEDYNVGIIANSRDPRMLADQVADFFENKELMESVAKNVQKASVELQWSKEEFKLIDPIKNLLN